MDFKFDLQDFLEKRFAEQREDLGKLATRVDAGFTLIDQRSIQVKSDLMDHEVKDLEALGIITARLTTIETMHKNIKWFSRSAIVAGLTFIGDILVNHVPRWLGKH